VSHIHCSHPRPKGLSQAMELHGPVMRTFTHTNKDVCQCAAAAIDDAAQGTADGEGARCKEGGDKRGSYAEPDPPTSMQSIQPASNEVLVAPRQLLDLNPSRCPVLWNVSRHPLHIGWGFGRANGPRPLAECRIRTLPEADIWSSGAVISKPANPWPTLLFGGNRATDMSTLPCVCNSRVVIQCKPSFPNSVAHFWHNMGASSATRNLKR
jgi:hypothetical protein